MNSTNNQNIYQNMDKNYAFTLAEVLITLAIIGVVAAMTMPTLLTKVQDNINRTRFKKALNTLNQAVALAYAKTDGTINFATTNKMCGGAGNNENTNSYTYFPNDNLKGGDSGSKYSICSLFNETLKTDKNFKLTDKYLQSINKIAYIETHGSMGRYLAYKLSDGAIFAFRDNAVACKQYHKKYKPYLVFGSLQNMTALVIKMQGSSSETIETSPGGHYCYGFIDVNGTNGPNQLPTIDGQVSNNYANSKIKTHDVFPVIFYDGIVAPAHDNLLKEK